MTLAKGADFFIVDSQYTPEELPEHTGWGHSSWKQAVEIGIEAGVKRIALFHHDQGPQIRQSGRDRPHFFRLLRG